MAIRLLPFRQYAETDVINLFSLESDAVNTAVTNTGAGDAGVFVRVTNGNLDDGPTVYDNTYMNYLGVNPNSLPYVGRNQYPRVPITVGPASMGDQAVGVTLYQTAESDENGEKLLYYPQKALETQSVLPGQAVPVFSRGIIAVAASTGAQPPNTANSACVLNLNRAFGGDGGTLQRPLDVVGSGVELTNDSNNADPHGQLIPVANDDATNFNDQSGVFGHILATGSRVVKSGQTADQFAGRPSDPVAAYGGGPGLSTTGYYAIIQFDTNQIAGNRSSI